MDTGYERDRETAESLRGSDATLRLPSSLLGNTTDKLALHPEPNGTIWSSGDDCDDVTLEKLAPHMVNYLSLVGLVSWAGFQLDSPAAIGGRSYDELHQFVTLLTRHGLAVE